MLDLICSGNLAYKREFFGKLSRSFSDDVLLHLLRMVKIPDVEFWINLGDWPMERRGKYESPAAIISWCGHEDFTDIVVPTYEVTSNTNGMMSNTFSDQFLIQNRGRSIPWNSKITKAFFRGRDSRQERLDLAELAQNETELLDVGITKYFFFKEDPKKYGETVELTPFSDFFKFKFQINIDGTVAAYRFAHLLLGNSVVLKQKSKVKFSSAF